MSDTNQSKQRDLLESSDSMNSLDSFQSFELREQKNKNKENEMIEINVDQNTEIQNRLLAISLFHELCIGGKESSVSRHNAILNSAFEALGVTDSLKASKLLFLILWDIAPKIKINRKGHLKNNEILEEFCKTSMPLKIIKRAGIMAGNVRLFAEYNNLRDHDEITSLNLKDTINDYIFELLRQNSLISNNVDKWLLNNVFSIWTNYGLYCTNRVAVFSPPPILTEFESIQNERFLIYERHLNKDCIFPEFEIFSLLLPNAHALHSFYSIDCDLSIITKSKNELSDNVCVLELLLNCFLNKNPPRTLFLEKLMLDSIFNHKYVSNLKKPLLFSQLGYILSYGQLLFENTSTLINDVLLNKGGYPFSGYYVPMDEYIEDITDINKSVSTENDEKNMDFIYLLDSTYNEEPAIEENNEYLVETDEMIETIRYIDKCRHCIKYIDKWIKKWYYKGNEINNELSTNMEEDIVYNNIVNILNDICDNAIRISKENEIHESDNEKSNTINKSNSMDFGNSNSYSDDIYDIIDNDTQIVPTLSDNDLNSIKSKDTEKDLSLHLLKSSPKEHTRDNNDINYFSVLKLSILGSLSHNILNLYDTMFDEINIIDKSIPLLSNSIYNTNRNNSSDNFNCTKSIKEFYDWFKLYNSKIENNIKLVQIKETLDDVNMFSNNDIDLSVKSNKKYKYIFKNYEYLLNRKTVHNKSNEAKRRPRQIKFWDYLDESKDAFFKSCSIILENYIDSSLKDINENDLIKEDKNLPLKSQIAPLYPDEWNSNSYVPIVDYVEKELVFESINDFVFSTNNLTNQNKFLMIYKSIERLIIPIIDCFLLNHYYLGSRLVSVDNKISNISNYQNTIKLTSNQMPLTIFIFDYKFITLSKSILLKANILINRLLILIETSTTNFMDYQCDFSYLSHYIEEMVNLNNMILFFLSKNNDLIQTLPGFIINAVIDSI